GDQVAFWKEASQAPTTGVPVGGGVLWNDSTCGFQWKSRYGIETTLAPGTISGGVTLNKRRVMGWKSQPVIYVATTTAYQTATSFDVSNFNNDSLSDGTVFARGKVLAFNVSSGGSP